jgi:hypoxanthine phosphoribosyltransferase
MEKIYFTWGQFDEAASKIAREIRAKIGESELNSIYGIPRGGLILAVALSHQLNLPIRDSVTPTTLVVDDISDTGNTLSPYTDCVVATIHYVKGSKVEPNIWVHEKKRGDWVVYPWEKEK